MTENLKELIQKYQNKTATETEKKIVEEKLTEYTLLQDLMLENESILDVPFENTSIEIDSKKMKRQINHKLTKSVLLIITSLISLGIIFYLLVAPLLNRLYFDPSAKDTSAPIPTFNLVSSLYTELTNPNFRLNSVTTTNDSVGSYIVNKDYDSTMNTLSSNSQTISYTIKRNKVLTPYEAYLPVVTPIAKINDDSDTTLYSDSKTQTLNKLKTLPKESEIDASFLFEKPLTIEETLQLFETDGFPSDSNYRVNWFSVDTPNLSIGFDWFASFKILQEYGGKSNAYLMSLNEKYPQLLPNAPQVQTIENYPKAMENHFISALTYVLANRDSLEKQESFYSLDELESILEDVKKQGVKINGVYLSGTTDAVVKFGEKKQVLNIDVLGTSLYSHTYSN